MTQDISRRTALRLLVFGGACAFASGCGLLEHFQQTTATIACPFTVDNPEGPFWKADAPFRRDIADGLAGQRLVIDGIVTRSDDCLNPLSGAIVDVWQADTGGVYDMTNAYLLRGRRQTGTDGRYEFETIVPGNYGRRPAHIHYRITHSEGRTLITQLYFDGFTYNDTDSLVRPTLIIPLAERAGVLHGTFNISLQPA